MPGLGRISNARQGNTLVSVSASGFSAAVPAGSPQPLAGEAPSGL